MTDKPIRVLRVMEYIYPDMGTMADDMVRWQAQGTYRPRNGIVIRSTTLPPEIWDVDEQSLAVSITRNTDPAKEQDLKTPELWAVEHNVYIVDADGWRGGSVTSDGTYLHAKDFDEPLSESEFLERLAFCTQGPRLR